MTAFRTGLGLALALTLGASTALAQKAYGPGVSDTEIKFGNTMPYSGPASSLGTVGKIMSAYFAMVNEKGGVNGRKLNMVSLDDGFAPPKTVEAAKRLVEDDQVVRLRHDGHGALVGDREISQCQQGAADFPDLVGLQVERSEGHALFDRAALGAQLHERGEFRRRLCAEEEPGRQVRGALPERRFRQGLRQGPERGFRENAGQAAEDDAVRGDRSDRGFAGRLARRHQGRRVSDLFRHAARLRAGDPQGL